MKFQVTKAFTITLKGRTTHFELGQRIGEKRYNSLSKRIQSSYFISARRAGNLNSYNNEERFLIASLYNEGNTRSYIVNMFRQLFGNTHPASSVGQKVEMCKAVDNTHPSHTKFQFRDEELILMLQELDGERYTLA